MKNIFTLAGATLLVASLSSTFTSCSKSDDTTATPTTNSSSSGASTPLNGGGDAPIKQVDTYEGQDFGTSTFVYDSNKYLMEIQKKGKTDESYTYDSNGNLTARKDASGTVITSFTYDSQNRLLQVSGSSDISTVSEWDSNGRPKKYKLKSLAEGFYYTQDHSLTYNSDGSIQRDDYLQKDYGNGYDKDATGGALCYATYTYLDDATKKSPFGIYKEKLSPLENANAYLLTKKYLSENHGLGTFEQTETFLYENFTAKGQPQKVTYKSTSVRGTLVSEYTY